MQNDQVLSQMLLCNCQMTSAWPQIELWLLKYLDRLKLMLMLELLNEYICYAIF